MADKILNVRIQNKYDTEANWKAKDPVLLKGEQAFTSDGTNAGKHKIGDGTSKWSALSYAKASLSKGDVTTALGYTPPASNTWRGIQNNLTSDSTSDSLSAAQGKVLKGLVDGKAASSHTHTIAQISNLQSTLDGKASSSHTHNYAGSSSAGGSANSAVKLTTARSISIGGFSSGSASFDGSGNITIDNWGYGCKKYVTQSSTSAPYFRIAYCEDKSNYSDRSMIFVIDSGYSGGGFGIVKVAFRSNDISKEGQSNCELKWLVRQGFSANQLFVKGNAPAGESQYADLYFKATTTYQAISITVLSMGNRGSKIRVWTFEEGNTRANPDIRKYTYTVEGSDAGTANYANSAGAVAWGNISGKPSTFTPASHTHSYAGAASSGGSATSAVKLDTATAGSSTQPVYFTGGKPTACTYTLGKSVPSNAVFTDTNTWRPLGTTADTACAGNDNRLSNARPASDVYSWAKASSKPSYSWSEITSKPSTFTPASHTHAYIPLSGGTITGSIIRSSGGSWISARNNVAVRGTATTKDSWNPVVGQATPNGYWTIGNLASNDNLAFSYTSNTNYNAGKNSATTVYLPVQEGTIITSATIGSQSVKYATSAGSAGSVAWGNVSGKPSSYTPSSHTHDDRYYTETEINTKLGAKLGAVSANGYYGMTRPDGNTSDWIRTTTAGIIPYQSGGAGAGHCGIGTSSWYFSNAYIDTVNCVNTNASGYLQANGLINTYSEYQSQKGSRDWRFGSATGSGDQNWFGFYDYTYGYHGGIYGPGHSLRMSGEIQSTAANGFRAVQGKYGFIIRNDGVNVYFMMTGNGDPWGGWNDNYTIFTPNGEWQVKKSPYDNGMSTARGYVVVSDSNDNRVYSISNYNANYLKVRCGPNTYHCTYSNSDIRLKKNINNTSITNALSVINSIKVRQFDWKETNIHQSIGFVADELEKLDPNFSQGGGVTKDGGIDVKSVNSFYLQGYIVKALQELSSQVSDLKQENKRLKQKLNMCN